MTDNAAIIQRLIDEAINRRDLTVIDQIVAEDYTYIDSAYGQLEGREELKRIINDVHTAFPDLHWTTEEQVEQGDKIVSRFSWTGTHRGEFNGLPATNKIITVNGVAFDHFMGGTMVETHMLRDDLSVLRQLGVVPERQVP